MDIEQTREEIIKRASEYKKIKQKRTMRILKCAEVGLVALLIMVMKWLPISYSISGDSYYGTLAMGSEAGSYILVGILCFLIGVVITLIAFKRRDDKKDL